MIGKFNNDHFLEYLIVTDRLDEVLIENKKYYSNKENKSVDE